MNEFGTVSESKTVTAHGIFNMNTYAKALKCMGVSKGDEVALCISNCPELVFALGAVSLLGAKVNIFGDDFDENYITEIINDCNSGILLIEDFRYEKIKNAICCSNVRNIIMTSLKHSLKDGKDPFYESDKKFGVFCDSIKNHISQNDKIIHIDSFIKIGESFQKDYYEKGNLDDEFTITYSSGSTNSMHPKAIVHCVRSFITIGRYHDKDAQGTASLKNLIFQAQIPTHSNTDIISSISDTLMQGAKLALEPIYDKEFFVESLLINKPNYIVATTSFWICAIKKVFYDEKYNDVKMPFLLFPFAVGEALSLGEEYFLNRGLRRVGAGRDEIKLPISPITMCAAGGDCEHGGIFWTIFRSLQSKLHFRLEGLGYFNMVEVAVLDEKGNHCPPNVYGRLVANSPCTMKQYKNNEAETEKFFIKDAYGKSWGNLNVYGYLDAHGKVFIKGRIIEKTKVPPFIVADCIAQEVKSILSCEVVRVEKNLYVAHIEIQPNSKRTMEEIIYRCNQRCMKKLGAGIASHIVYKVHSFEESFALTGCGKRDYMALRNEKITTGYVKPLTKNKLISYCDKEID